MIKHFKILILLLFISNHCFSQTKILKLINDSLLIKPNFLILKSFENKNSSLAMLGISIASHINKKTDFKFQFDYLNINDYKIIEDFYDSLSIYPNFNDKNVRLRYNINHQLNSFFNIQAGKGNNFIGEGYRSLLLSNNQAAYSYVKLTTKFGKVTYSNLYSTLYNLNNNNLNKKFSATHYLNININSKINIGIFESILWQPIVGGQRFGYEIGYINPIIFYRPVEFSNGSIRGNALMGLNFSFQLKNKKFYSQFLLDDINIKRQKNRHDNYSSGFFQNKYALQLGFLYSLKSSNFLFEFNQSQPYTYAHKIPNQNYSHMNQSLAHPFGSNFKEFVSIVNFKKNKIMYRLEFNLTKIGLDSLTTHYGQNIFASDYDASTGGEWSYGNYNGQGVNTSIILIKPEISYKFKYFDLFSSIYYLKKKSDLVDQTSMYLLIGIRNIPFSIFPF